MKTKLNILFDQTTFVCDGPLSGLLMFFAGDEFNASSVEVRLQVTEWINFANLRDEKILYEDSYVLWQPQALEGEESGYDVLHKGRHVFPWSFRLPDNLPSSFADSKKCGVQYMVYAVVHHMDKEKEYTAWRIANVCENLKGLHDIEKPRRARGIKRSTEDQLLEVHLTTNKTWYAAGEPCFVSLDIYNKSDDRVKAIKTRFMRQILGKTSTYERFKPFFEQTLDYEDIDVLPFSHRRIVIQAKTPEDARSIWNCSTFGVEWLLHVSLTDSSSYENIKIDVPLRIVPAASYNTLFFSNAEHGICPSAVEAAEMGIPEMESMVIEKERAPDTISSGDSSVQKRDHLTVAAGVPVMAAPTGLTSSVVITGLSPATRQAPLSGFQAQQQPRGFMAAPSMATTGRRPTHTDQYQVFDDEYLYKRTVPQRESKPMMGKESMMGQQKLESGVMAAPTGLTSSMVATGMDQSRVGSGASSGTMTKQKRLDDNAGIAPGTLEAAVAPQLVTPDKDVNRRDVV